MGADIQFESVGTTTKINFFNQHIIEFDNRLDLNYHQYQTHINFREENQKVKFLFTTNKIVSLGTYFQSMFYMQKNH